MATRFALILALLFVIGFAAGLPFHQWARHRTPCVREPISQAAWRSAAIQLGVNVGDIGPGVDGYHHGSGWSITDCAIAAPLTSLDIIAHGHLKAITLDNGEPGVQISGLAPQPVSLGDIQPGESKQFTVTF